MCTIICEHTYILEPFLNSKINFAKIKPLLDQFQGCYKEMQVSFLAEWLLHDSDYFLLIIVKMSDKLNNQY